MELKSETHQVATLRRILRILSFELDIKHVVFRSQPWPIVYNAPQFLPADSKA